MTVRSTALVFASLLAIAAAPFASAHADTMSMPAPTTHIVVLPGQPGADTSQGQELRAQPYPATTEWSQFKPTPAMHNGMHTSQMSPSIYGSLTLPANLIF